MTTRVSIATIAVGMLLAVVAAPAAQADRPAQAGRPAQMSPEAYQALHRQSWALNVIYGLGKPAEMTHAEYRAELIRSTALNERYGLPVVFTSGQIAPLYNTGRTTTQEPAPPTSEPRGETNAARGDTSVPRGDAFDWSDAAIGAVFMAGLALIGAAGVLVVGRRAHVPHLRH
jgi:hypothetical protein